jgi:hypothetical protein
MKSQVEALKDRILQKKSEESQLTGIMELIRELGCFGDILGREFEVKDRDGIVVYTVRQKPMAIKQLNVLLKEVYILKKLDNEREAAKWGKKK